MDEIKKLVLEATAEMVALRRDLHEHPELGYQEERTASLVESALKSLGLADVRRVTKTGVSALLEGGESGPVLLLRADLDALPVDEDSGVPFASKNPGVMHACAHDGHTAILLTAAKILSGLKGRLKGSIKFVFEPNEEEVGALAMIEEGVMENPKVEAAAGLHLWAPLPLGRIAVDPGACWAGMDHFTIKVRGKGGHTAAPHTAVDPILAAAHIVTGVQVLQSRELDPFLASSLVFGRISGGKAANIIPDEVELEGTIRYLFDGSDDGPYKPRVRLKKLVESLAAAYRAEAEINFYCSQPSLENDPAMCEIGREAAREVLGENGSLVPFLNLGGEDFSEFSARVPSVFAMIGAGSEKSGAVYPHHHPKFRIDEDSLAIGLEWILRTALKFLA
ncbi:amidohydrolase [Deltaproteobacteria bacterium Smac51]|nr:amidohydrolase [Deltaproteobacteria bacterium Smac51]